MHTTLNHRQYYLGVDRPGTPGSEDSWGGRGIWGEGGLAHSPIQLEILDGLVTLYVMLTLAPTSHNTASERRSTQCCLHCDYEPQTSASNYVHVASQAPFDLATCDVPNLGPDAPVHVKYLSSIQRQKGLTG